MTISDEQVKADIRKRYDHFAQVTSNDWEASIGKARWYFWLRKLETALRLGSFPPGAHLLEVGCNMGQLTFPLVQRGYRVSGADLSQSAIAAAQQKVRDSGITGVDFVVADAESLSPFADRQFDGVVSFSTLRYVPNLRNALAAIRRVLKPGATAVMDFPNRLCPWFYLKSWLGSESHPHDHWFTPGELRKECEDCGFSVTATRTILFTPTVAPDRLLKAFQTADYLGERTPVLKNFAGIIMIAVRAR